MEKTVSYSLAVKGIGGGAVIYPHKIGVLETAKSRSLDLSTISGLLKKINFSVFTNLPSLPAGRLNCNEKILWGRETSLTMDIVLFLFISYL